MKPDRAMLTTTTDEQGRERQMMTPEDGQAA
jgi:hypothetical protein